MNNLVATAMTFDKETGLNLEPKRWAQVFAAHTHPAKLEALRQYFTSQDQAFHSQRCRERQAANGMSKADH